MKPLVSKTLEIARGQIGIRESPAGSNAGPRVEQYLASTGLDGGYPWCAAFINWCIEQAARELKVQEPWPRTAGCAVIDSWAKEHDIRVIWPEPGDVFLSYSKPEGFSRASHTGFVTEAAGGSFTTVEGNTNLDGGREGIGVFKREREIAPRYKFVRWQKLLEEQTPQPKYHLYYEEKDLAEMPVRGGVSWCPVRIWAKALDLNVSWNQQEQQLFLNGKEFPDHIEVIDGIGYAPIRSLAQFSGLQVSVDAQRQLVKVSRAGN